MIVKKSPKAAIDLPQAAPNHDRDFFLAISLVAQSFQRARTADDFYRAVGNAINSLGGVVTLLTVNEDGTSLTVAYTSSESKFYRALNWEFRDYYSDDRDSQIQKLLASLHRH